MARTKQTARKSTKKGEPRMQWSKKELKKLEKREKQAKPDKKKSVNNVLQEDIEPLSDYIEPVVINYTNVG